MSESGPTIGRGAQRDTKALLQLGEGGLGDRRPKPQLNGICGDFHVQGVNEAKTQVGGHKKPAVFIQPR